MPGGPASELSARRACTASGRSSLPVPLPDQFAIISDVHGNLEAANSVLEAIADREIETIYCLGDTVGYGPDPEECVDLVRDRCVTSVRGNHDDALFTGADRFHALAQDAIRFTRERLRPRLLRGRKGAERWEWLKDLPLRHREGEALFVHGSPVNPVNEYVYQEDVYFNADTKLRRIFEHTDLVTFNGHTHLPVAITSDLETFIPKDGESTFVLEPGRKYIINAGSVGQPRDRDCRACWLEVEKHTVTWHREEYDHSSTAEKINRIPLLDEILGLRLARGM
jgi:diadenosine tetraphosphatase ApaH/serine/threonine PP2A family protein phosphatase